MYFISQELINQFADISGDHNPIHVDVETANKTKFGGTIAHGALLIALLSAELAKQYPGVVLGKIGMEFYKPVKSGSTVHFVVSVDELGNVSVEVMVGTARVAQAYAKLHFPKVK
jgi:3-hydroxybutyryl-CoA dehydratase